MTLSHLFSELLFLCATSALSQLFSEPFLFWTSKPEPTLSTQLWATSSVPQFSSSTASPRCLATTGCIPTWRVASQPKPINGAAVSLRFANASGSLAHGRTKSTPFCTNQNRALATSSWTFYRDLIENSFLKLTTTFLDTKEPEGTLTSTSSNWM